MIDIKIEVARMYHSHHGKTTLVRHAVLPYPVSAQQREHTFHTFYGVISVERLFEKQQING